MKSYSYQYETSPRKIRPEYNNTKKSPNRSKNKSTAKKNSNPKQQQNKKQQSKKEQTKKNTNSKNKEVENKKNNSSNVKVKFAIFAKSFFIFLVFFFIIYRNSIITQSFAEIQRLKTSITNLQKENNQLEINIQNSLNTNNIEQAAKELLGMQKLTNKQIVYISLSKTDYVEPRIEEVLIEKSPNVLERIIEKIKNIF